LDLAPLEQEDRRDRVDAVRRGDLAVFARVELADLELAFVRARELLDDGREHLARHTTLGPDIDEDGLVCVQNLALEVVACELDNRCAGHGCVLRG